MRKSSYYVTKENNLENIKGIYKITFNLHDIAIVNDLQVMIYNDNLAAVVMLDLSAAFDKVDYQRLLFKLKHYFGINGNVLKWLTLYLNNRTLAVVKNNICSTKKSLRFGVLQVSILDALLFIMYINELTNLGSKFDTTIHSYADDTTLYIGFSPRWPVECY